MKYRDVVRMIVEDGWYLVRQKGSHKQYHHKLKSGTVTIAGKDSHDVHPKTLKSILTQAQMQTDQK